MWCVAAAAAAADVLCRVVAKFVLRCGALRKYCVALSSGKSCWRKFFKCQVVKNSVVLCFGNITTQGKLSIYAELIWETL